MTKNTGDSVNVTWTSSNATKCDCTCMSGSTAINCGNLKITSSGSGLYKTDFAL